jgi:hypothetical protein
MVLNPLVNMLKVILVSVVTLIFSLEGATQYKFLGDTLLAEKLAADLDFFEKQLLEVHPQPFVYVTPSAFEEQMAELRRQVAQGMTLWEFYKGIGQIYHALGDSHSLVSFDPVFDAYKKNGGRHLELQIREVEGKVFILKLGDSTLTPVMEWVKINGREVKPMLDSIARGMVTEGQSVAIARGMAQRLFPKILPFMVPIDSLNVIGVCAFGDSVLVEHLVIGRGKALPQPKKNRSQKRQEARTSREAKEKEFLFDFLEPELAYLKIPSFSGGSFTFYQQFLKESFQKLERQQAPVLVIDLRGNTGGSLKRTLDLLGYVVKDSALLVSNIMVKQSPFSKKINRAPFVARLLMPLSKRKNDMAALAFAMSATPLHATDTVYFHPVKVGPSSFKGSQLYVLSDELSASASALFCGAVQQQGLGKVIGLSPAGTIDGVWGQAHYFDLPHSKLRVRMATLRFNFDNEHRFRSDALVPDYWMPTTSQDFVNHSDTQLTFVKTLIQEGFKK